MRVELRFRVTFTIAHARIRVLEFAVCRFFFERRSAFAHRVVRRIITRRRGEVRYDGQSGGGKSGRWCDGKVGGSWEGVILRVMRWVGLVHRVLLHRVNRERQRSHSRSKRILNLITFLLDQYSKKACSDSRETCSRRSSTPQSNVKRIGEELTRRGRFTKQLEEKSRAVRIGRESQNVDEELRSGRRAAEQQ